MWRELVARSYPVRTFQPAASPATLDQAERRLGRALPPDLRDLLSETDGVFGEYSLGLVWPVERIVEDNLRFRSDRGLLLRSAGFDDLLFFGDAGNGDQFAFRLTAGRWDPDIVAWDHEDDRRVRVAPDLRRYLEWWADGRLKL